MFKLMKPSPDLLVRVERDGRVGASFGVKQKWNTFELSSPQDLRDALAWFSEAYEAAHPIQKVRVNQKGKQSSRNTRRELYESHTRG
jgi:hypothetical protein